MNRRELLKSLVGVPVAVAAVKTVPTQLTPDITRMLHTAADRSFRDVYKRWLAEGPLVYRPGIGDVIVFPDGEQRIITGCVTSED